MKILKLSFFLIFGISLGFTGTTYYLIFIVNLHLQIVYSMARSNCNCELAIAIGNSNRHLRKNEKICEDLKICKRWSDSTRRTLPTQHGHLQQQTIYSYIAI